MSGTSSLANLHTFLQLSNICVIKCIFCEKQKGIKRMMRCRTVSYVILSVVMGNNF